MIINFIYFNNQVLLKNTNIRPITELIGLLLKMIKRQKNNDYWDSHILDCLRCFIHYKTEVIYVN